MSIPQGLGANLRADELRAKQVLEAKIKLLDHRADSLGLDDVGWQNRYDLEAELVNIHLLEEIYWKRRGNLSWILKGDSSTAYFQAIVNGRHCRCLIASLTINEGPCTDPALISTHIYEFFSDLLSERPPSGLSFYPKAWGWQPTSLT